MNAHTLALLQSEFPGATFERVALLIPPVRVESRHGALEWGWCTSRLLAVRHVPGMRVYGRDPGDVGITTDGERWVPVHVEPDLGAVCVPDGDRWWVLAVREDGVSVYSYAGAWAAGGTYVEL